MYGYYVAIGGRAITGHMDRTAAERAAGSSEFATVMYDRVANSLRPWWRPNGARFRDAPGHGCALHEDMTSSNWRCTICGRAWTRDLISPSPYVWIRDPISDAPWRDGGERMRDAGPNPDMSPP